MARPGLCRLCRLSGNTRATLGCICTARSLSSSRTFETAILSCCRASLTARITDRRTLRNGRLLTLLPSPGALRITGLYLPGRGTGTLLDQAVVRWRLAIAHTPPVRWIMLPMSRLAVLDDLTAGVRMEAMRRARVEMMVVVVMVHHEDLPLRPMKCTEIERRGNVVRGPPVKDHAATTRARIMPKDRRVRLPPPRTVNNPRVVHRHVHHTAAGWLNGDVPRFANHLDLLVAAQVTMIPGTAAELLDSIDDRRLLKQERIAQTVSPVDIVTHSLQQTGEGHKCHHAGVPGFLCHELYRQFAGHALVGCTPASRLDHFQGIGRGNQNMRQDTIRI